MAKNPPGRNFLPSTVYVRSCFPRFPLFFPKQLVCKGSTSFIQTSKCNPEAESVARTFSLGFYSKTMCLSHTLNIHMFSLEKTLDCSRLSMLLLSYIRNLIKRMFFTVFNLSLHLHQEHYQTTVFC